MVHILKACGVEEPLCYSALSFSLSRDTTQEEIEKGAEIIAETALQLQKYSQYMIEEV